MRYFLFFHIIFLPLFCANPSENKKASENENVQELKNDSIGISVKPFQIDGGWGYDIYIDGKRYIHQPHLPAVGGNQPFATELQAKKVGAFVADKIGRGIMPPSVTPAEVDSLIKATE